MLVHWRVCVGYYELAFGHAEWSVWEIPLPQNDNFLLLRNRLALLFVSPPSQHFSSLAVPAGTRSQWSRERRWPWSGAGQGDGGAAGWCVGLGTTLWSIAFNERGMEKETVGTFVWGWCLPSQCREREGTQQQDDAGRCRTAKIQSDLVSCKLSEKPSLKKKKKKRSSWERQQQ